MALNVTQVIVQLTSGKQITLTSDEARELQLELAALLGIEQNSMHWPGAQPFENQPVPIIIERCPERPVFHPWELTWGTADGQPMCGATQDTLLIGEIYKDGQEPYEAAR